MTTELKAAVEYVQAWLDDGHPDALRPDAQWKAILAALQPPCLGKTCFECGSDLVPVCPKCNPTLSLLVVQPVPGGEWVVVPKEPTEAMIDAHFGAHASAGTVFAHPRDIWGAMIAAAPSPLDSLQDHSPLGAEEAPSCGSPSDSQTVGGA